MANLLSKFFNKSKTKQVSPKVPRLALGVSGGTIVNEDTAMKVSAFHRGVTYVSTQIAKLPWDVKDKDNNIIFNKISTLIRMSPNPEMNTFMFRVCMIINAIIHGNSYAEIERNGMGEPVALWPLRTDSVELVRDTSGTLWYRVMGGHASGRDVLLRPMDMFHIKNFHTTDGLTGNGIVAFAMETLGIGLGADRLANNIYANKAMPSGILTTPGALSDEAFERIKDSWDKNHGGRKTGGTAILEEGLEFKAISMSPDVMQFLESRKFTVLEIARFLGVPPTKLFDGQSATYNNIEHSNLEVATDTLDAWANNFEMEANVKLLNNARGGKKTEMDLYAIFRGDMKTRGEYFSRRMSTGSMTPNQIRIKEGDAPYVGGDRYFIATNNYTPSDRMDEVIDSQIKNKEPAKKTDEEKEADKAVTNYLNNKVK